jgi:hypothetical protein
MYDKFSGIQEQNKNAKHVRSALRNKNDKKMESRALPKQIQ